VKRRGARLPESVGQDWGIYIEGGIQKKKGSISSRGRELFPSKGKKKEWTEDKHGSRRSFFKKRRGVNKRREVL